MAQLTVKTKLDISVKEMSRISAITVDKYEGTHIFSDIYIITLDNYWCSIKKTKSGLSVTITNKMA